MKVQKIQLGVNCHSYIVIGNDYLPVKPILKFIRYLDSCDKSVNTIRAYANHLKLFWDYLTELSIDWQKVTLDQLSEFIRWLRTTKEFLPQHKTQLQETEKIIKHAKANGLERVVEMNTAIANNLQLLITELERQP